MRISGFHGDLRWDQNQTVGNLRHGDVTRTIVEHELTPHRMSTEGLMPRWRVEGSMDANVINCLISTAMRLLLFIWSMVAQLWRIRWDWGVCINSP